MRVATFIMIVIFRGMLMIIIVIIVMIVMIVHINKKKKKNNINLREFALLRPVILEMRA